VTCLAYAANTLWCLGYAAKARQRSAESLALAQALAHPHSLALAQHFAISLHHRCRDIPAVQEQAQVLMNLSTSEGFPLWKGFAICWQGWALTMQGQAEAGLAQMQTGMAAVLATGQILSQAHCLVLLSEAAGHVGQNEEGLQLLCEALKAFEATGRGELLAETYRLQGEFLLRQAMPDVAQAEACLQRALALARQQQAKSWELRAATSLCRLWQRQGKHEQARVLFLPIYRWFTEGFDTANLQEAARLVEELR
jgi:predicted ATPase